MSPPEFSRPVNARQIATRPLVLEASAEERKALARRFGIVAIDQLQATVRLERAGDAILARGRLSAAIVQSCAVSGEDLPVRIDEPLALRFVPAAEPEGEEIELDAEDLDEIPFEGDTFDLGEEIAQSLALAIDPYAVGPEAERVRREQGLLEEGKAGALAAALAAIKKS